MLAKLRSLVLLGIFLLGRCEDVKKIQNFHCQFFNWRYLQCEWTTVGDTLDLNFRYFFDGAKEWGKCPKLSAEKDSCKFDMSIDALRDTLWRFKISVGDHVYYFSCHPEDVVKPDPVQDWEVNSTEKASCLSINWHYSPYFSKIVKIAYINEWNETKEVNTSRSKLAQESMKICGLIPNSWYTFTLSVISGDEKGFWSEKVTKYFRTKETVPGAAPPIAVGNYERDIQNCDKDYSTATVTVYWKEIKRRYQNGKIIGYNITIITQNSGMVTEKFIENGNSTSAQLQLKCDEAYKVVVSAANNKGTSRYNSTVLIASSTNKYLFPPRDVLVLLEKEENKLTYNISLPVTCDNCNYTVHYCRQTLQTCSEDLETVSVPVSQPFYLLKDQAHPVQIGVSVDRGLNSSGFQFIRCIYNRTAVPAVVKDVQVAPQPDNGLTISWTAATKCSRELPYVVQYTLVYCEVNTNKQCTGEETVVNVTTNEYVIEDLDTKKEYGVQITSSSWYRTGNHSEMRTARPKNNDLSTTVKVIIGVCSFIVTTLAIMGCVFMIRFCKEKREAFKDLDNIDIPYIECPRGQETQYPPANQTMHNLLPTNVKDIESKPLLSVSKKFGQDKNSLDSGRGTMPEQEKDQNGIDGNVQHNLRVSFIPNMASHGQVVHDTSSGEADSSVPNHLQNYTTIAGMCDSSDDESNQQCPDQSDVAQEPCMCSDTFTSRTNPSSEPQNEQMQFSLDENTFNSPRVHVLKDEVPQLASTQLKCSKVEDNFESPWIRRGSCDKGDNSLQARYKGDNIPHSSMSNDSRGKLSDTDKGSNSVSEYVKKHINCSQDSESDDTNTMETSFKNSNDPKLIKDSNLCKDFELKNKPSALRAAEQSLKENNEDCVSV